MKITYKWLKDFVDIRVSAQRLSEMLTMAGQEVTSLEKRDGDVVFEIEVTSNRPDCLSVLGIAREVAAIMGKKIKFSLQPSALNFQLKADSRKLRADSQKLIIKIENKKDCPLYTGKIIKDLKVGPSPDWLRKRLELVGCRSVNNIVDITNYVLFEYGAPLHAFDRSQLSGGSIIVRRAKNGEKLTTIDEKQRVLNTDNLIIADYDKPVAIAGVMGGRDTEVARGTVEILLEAAIFDPILVRRSRQKLGLQSESSYRFERGIDPQIVEQASLRAVALIEKLAGGRCRVAGALGVAQSKRRTIVLDLSRVNKNLGVNIPASQVKKILHNLGLRVKAGKKNIFSVEPPSYRPDLNLAVDLIEEIARIYGFELIPTTQPAIRPRVSRDNTQELVSLTKRVLVGLGLREVITYSLIDKGLLASFGSDAKGAIEILNPLSSEQEVLRPALIPSLSRCIAYNLNQKQDYVSIFEIANTYSASNSGPKEELVLGIAFSGSKTLLFEQGAIKNEFGLLHLKGIAEVFFNRLGIKDYDFTEQGNPEVIPVYVNKEHLGSMVRLSRTVLNKLDIKNKEIFALEISLSRIFSHANLKKQFAALPKFPGIARDISVTLEQSVSIKQALAQIEEIGKPLLKSARIIDSYKGKQIPCGYKAFTISCEYRSDQRTLTEAEINPAHAAICRELAERFGATIR
ncbi:MAG: phenylalanine--tRNA ligase subunit beta [Candidatus Omnitrophica bacterium]|nr:phenylalanine--tRNA ligase subunit beta [Candidatus Omnitrophota bacterium]